jgi:GH24 family phage-related lysozyme (muramidase)
MSESEGLHMGDHTQLKAMLPVWEGTLPHMYLDTAGLVTVGVGHMIPDSEAARGLNFVVRADGSAATPDQIAAEHVRISQQQKGLVAQRYLPFTTLDMPDSAIQDLLSADIAYVEAGVRSKFTGYDDYPEPAQDALLDMAFNLGVDGLAGHFPRLRAAAEVRDWATCAAQCHRAGISEERNEKTQALFESAAT